MKCLFCNRLLAVEEDITGVPPIKCLKCAVHYFLEYNSDSYEIRYYNMVESIKEGTFLIEFYLDDGATGLYEKSPDGFKRIMALDYIPNVTPKTKKAWLNKIMGMKAFL